MAVFVINEWLWADLSGDNGLEAQRQGFGVIEKLAASDHQIVIIEGSAFDEKAWNLCRNEMPMIVRRMAGVYVVGMRQNSDRCHILKAEEVVSLPSDLAMSIKGDDHYLVQAQLSVAGAIIVTTDNPLREALDAATLRCMSRQEFLDTYF
jgi:hypothetical protein